ncbi:MAG: DICT sensory domain-containing protein, partial [Actinomycetes bacterium]
MSGTHLPPMFASLRDVAGQRVEYARLSKATLADLSHVLEDIVEDRDRRSLVLTGFQVGRNWVAEMERYERLGAGERRSVAVFTDAALPDAVRVEPFLLREASGLRQEWFVLTLTEEFSCALFGIDHPELGDPVEEMDRVFDAAWTFDPELVRELVEVVLREAQSSDPDRAARLREAAAAVGTTSLSGDVERRFHREVFEVLEAGRRRLRRQLVLEQELHERLHRANLELLRLERLAAIGTTVASLAHELNNPLHAISMLADLIADAGPDELDTAREHAAQVGALAARAGRLTRGLLDLGRAAQPSPRRIALDAWLRDLAQEQTLAVRTEVVTDLAASDVVVEVDPDRLRHVLT